MTEHIANDVFNKLMKPSDDFSDFVGIKMVGIVGPSGIGKSTIGRALFSQLSSLFHHHAFVSYKSIKQWDDYSMKLYLDERLLSEISCQKGIKISHLGVAKQILNRKKVLIIVDDMDDLEVINTLVGQTRLVGSGSRIIVITQDRKLLKSQKIELIYEVDFPSYNLAMQMFCRSAFGENYPPYGFSELAVEVANLSGYLPLGLNVLGSSLKGMTKEEWVDMLPRLRNSLDGKIEKTLRVSYDGLDSKDQELFLYIACLFSGHEVNHIKYLLGDSVRIGLRVLADKSLIHITPSDKIEMHSLLQKLGTEIDRAESINNPGKRRFLREAEDICDVLTDNIGTESVLAMYLNMSEISEPLFIDENAFRGMRNLKFLNFYKNGWLRGTGKGKLYLPRGIVHFPRKLRLLHWDEYPSKCMPFCFKAEGLVELRMMNSQLEKLWEGTQLLGSLKKMNMSCSADLKEIPDLSKAINLEELNLEECTSLVTLPSSIRNLNKLWVLNMWGCSGLKILPADVNLKYLTILNLGRCSQLSTFPRITRKISELYLNETALKGDEDSSWIENICQLRILNWDGAPLSCMPPHFDPEYLHSFEMRGGRLQKLWERIKSLQSLWMMDLSGCESLVEIPDLSMATQLEFLKLKNCKSLVMLPSSFRNLNRLVSLNMDGCTMLEVLPTDVNLRNLQELDLSGCSKLRNFPQISTNIEYLYLDDTGIEEIPSWIEKMSHLRKLRMSRCKKLKNVSLNIFKLKYLEADFSDCGGITTMCDQLPGPHKASVAARIGIKSYLLGLTPLGFYNCFNLDRDAQELIIQSHSNGAVIPGGEVPMYFTHRACGRSLSILLSESSLSQEYMIVKTCIVVGPSSHPNGDFGVRWCFRGEKGVIRFGIKVASYEMDHLVLIGFDLRIKEVDNPASELNNNNVLLLEFYNANYDEYFGECSCSSFSHTENCTLVRIKGCGARIIHISEIDYQDSDEKSAEENDEESDEESNRSKKKMRMTVPTSQEHSNSLYIQTVVNSRLLAQNLELSLGLAGAYGEVSSGSKVSSPSRNFHDDGAASFDPCLRRESLHFEPMIIEQQDRGLSNEDPSFSPQLIDFFT
ncbi:protein SUPPRESSOR OF npr1-1, CONSTITUTIVE 1 isoform X2 [Brassica napus]|nr:PREDICTED: protein SUPPRESSOR OF npr1-1, CONSTITUTIVE 1-like isoform X2 [Brassica oleracea var. oleracea]XP_048602076.1 protein SUPPRESSOR OF npr1-1, CONSTITUTIVE 1 isoform X2 [Brassica napus]